MTYLLTSEDWRKLEEAMAGALVALESVRSYPDFDCDNVDEPRPLCAMAKTAQTSCDAALSLLAGLPKVPDADARNAKRYRWLRDVSVPPHNFYISVPEEFNGVRYSAPEVDAYIDAAMKEHPQP